MKGLFIPDITVEMFRNGCLEAIEAIMAEGEIYDIEYDLKSAQPERIGRWNTYYHSDIDFSHSCNQCGYSAPYQMIGGEFFQKKWNFCPNCGADMREGEEE